MAEYEYRINSFHKEVNPVIYPPFLDRIDRMIGIKKNHVNPLHPVKKAPPLSAKFTFLNF